MEASNVVVNGSAVQRVTLGGGLLWEGGEYEELEYLESTGTQWIDTGVLATKDIEFEVSCYYNSVVQKLTGECVFGMRRFPSGSSENEWWYMAVSNYRYAANLEYGYARFGNNHKHQSTQPGIHKYVFSYKGGIYSNGVGITTAVDFSNDNVPVTPMPDSWTMFLFAGNYVAEPNDKDPFRGKVYYCDIWQGGVAVRSFRPARRIADGELGMLDMVTGELFTNQGKGVFVAGPKTGKRI